MVAVECHDEIAAGTGETSLVTAAITSNGLADHLCAIGCGNIGGSICRSVIDDYDLIYEIGHTAQHQLDPLFLIKTWNDNCDRLRFIHVLESKLS